MKGVSSEIVGAIYQLLTGFIVSWVIYGLTSYLKPSTFERVVHALIFTVFVRTILIVFRFCALFIGSHIFSFGYWSSDIELVWSIILAIFLGLLGAWCINNDFPLYLFRSDGEEKCPSGLKWFHNAFSKIKLTDKTLHPTEWYSAFHYNERFITLHLIGERRLYGWPKQYPDDPQKGHFIIQEAEWLLDDGSSAPLYTVKEILIPASSVELIEFSKRPYHY